MIPARLPAFLNKLKNGLFPKYFIYSLLATGSEAICENLNIKGINIDKLYAKEAIKLIKMEKNNNDPNLIWAITLLSGYHWKYVDLSQMNYLLGNKK
ncbi:hypothetical protein AYI69_g3479 [Smittium culicis]|uniref:Uncharacterized protein n=1 Tax=Smittium culicis TaxID=133412 RepID=A0A1R1YJL4_9FUNG|nr:hypothetical protein AYI69_g3479 [Smittium culicis]